MEGGRDVRDWDEDAYRDAILREREVLCCTVFSLAFAPNPDCLVAASSDGSIAAYSISSCIASSRENPRNRNSHHISQDYISFAEPLCSLQGHKGPAYDAKFYGEGEDSLLLSCGDDGRIVGWKWKDIMDASFLESGTENFDMTESSKPVLEFVNSQHKGPWNALSPIPENNAIDVNEQQGLVFSAAGDACAYCWDVETGHRLTVFQGHSDYLHCIVACKSSSQVITGSEDGTARLWDCRNGKCIKVISPEDCTPIGNSWIGSIAIDSNENWLACGSRNKLSVWSLPSCQCIWSIDSHVPVQDVLFDNNQVLAVGCEPALTRFNINGSTLSRLQCFPPSVFAISHHPSGMTAIGGYGGMIDIISEYGTHLCVFRCPGE